MNRNYFLRSFLGLLGWSTSTQLVSCTDDSDEIMEETPPVDTAYALLKEQTQEDGFFREGTNLLIDVSHSKYQTLANVDDYLNDTENYLLLLRSSSTTVKAFSNCCPHLGTTDQWTYSQGIFRCNNHGNSFSTGSGNFVRCNSRRTSGNLQQYPTTLDRDILTVDLS